MLSKESAYEIAKRNRHDYHLSEIIRQRAWIEIHAEALIHNVKEIKRLLLPKTSLMAVVKADAYGHGAIKVAQIALQAGANSLATATLTEGIELREAGITAPILILGAINTPKEIAVIARWQLQPTLCNPQQALVFSDTLSQLEESLPVHLKLDTGMSRLGTPWHQAREFVGLVSGLPYLKIASLYSHLATADNPDTEVMQKQHQRFEKVISQLKTHLFKLPPLHLANSAATLINPNLHYDLVRVGLALYGLYPAPHLRLITTLKPVLQVKAKITQVKTIPPGTGVSYGYQFVSDRPMSIAVVGIGYADGVPRNLSNRLEVLIRGKRVRQIGAITMDQLMLDVSSITDIQVGEIVTLIGKDRTEEITADDWANALGTISWEILCGFKYRLPRILIDS
ncbi:alanine racemase [cyanobacterium endosymbiont of Epithemia turgida]|uniref:alanine racemase n=1 Tax=cyanobacterium endosymbiont of Epithemia turgida TaxID=718217 RepID=UPI0004D112FB|nr:alanine racemase [cyanobacterium endosymbiont of Epithemia turgida]BAP17859.1 alanine racemase [cyanobacterium endosymbiont of Epithemia turgida isolate EtSB Lake Yunoko]